MIRTETGAQIGIELCRARVDGDTYAAVTIRNHAAEVTVALDRDELRTLIGDGVRAWGELGQE
ncbi:hypothetical protein [Nocardia farcinica]|uniref:Uncharacterized protein n=1 Tax=Nocardia farcinica (strain IFM 10152) TaxID=247156 RepID=Q5YSL6_NOCFA|nr:hypothetical protein [Nocardia farcinica]BAD58825.1 hypothetical protein NFA_39770 [Nocardia farcinica IFM 10152]